MNTQPHTIATADGVIIAEQRRIDADRPPLPEDLRTRVIAGTITEGNAHRINATRNDENPTLAERISNALAIVDDLEQIAADADDQALAAELHAAYFAIERLRTFPGRPQRP